MFKEYSKRLIICLLGLACYALGNFFGVLAGGAGTNAWNTLGIGIANSSGMSFGTATLMISLVIIVIDLLGKGKLGIGTVLNIFVISALNDVFLEIITFLPPADTVTVPCPLVMSAAVIRAFSSMVPMSPVIVQV